VSKLLIRKIDPPPEDRAGILSTITSWCNRDDCKGADDDGPSFTSILELLLDAPSELDSDAYRFALGDFSLEWHRPDDNPDKSAGKRDTGCTDEL
jgi:hypothetical protein